MWCLEQAGKFIEAETRRVFAREWRRRTWRDKLDWRQKPGQSLPSFRLFNIDF